MLKLSNFRVFAFLGMAAAGFGLSQNAHAQVTIHESCPYDTSVLAQKSGLVTKITGDGIMLDDGTDIVLPENLLPYARLSQSFSVRGLKGIKNQNKFWALAVDLGADKGGLVCVGFGDALKGAYAGTDSYDVINGGVRPTSPL